MARAGLWGALAFSVTGGAISVGDVRADQQSCAQFRDAIIRMETESVRPPGWFALDQHLRALYRQDCLINPTRKPPTEYWYTEEGKPTGVLASGADRPADGAYATTPEINERCVERGLKEPGMCVMIENLRAACANPVDTQARNHCTSILGKDEKPSLPPPGEALPPISVGLDGGPYTLSANCDALLGRLSGDPLLDSASTTERARWQQIMRSECPDFLDALKRRTGVDPDKDPGKFWPAVGELAFNGFAPPGVPVQTPASVKADPGWQRMCNDAEKHRNTCMERLQGMRSNPEALPRAAGTYGQGSPNPDNVPDPITTSNPNDRDRTSQTGAFAQCSALYGQVLNMCKATENVAKKTAARLPPPAPPKPAPPPAAAKPVASSGGDSRPPPQQQAPGPDCQRLVSNYVGAAQANDGQRALAGYNALKAAGGCGVLSKVDKGAPVAQAPAPPPPAFPTRGATPNTDAYVQPCNADQAGCTQAMRQLERGTSPQAQAALVMHAISTGLELGAAMANGLSAAMPQGGGGGRGQYNTPGNNTDMRSLAAPPIRGGVGQGSGATPQRNSPSDITGTK
ncbi:hypothetical protein SAMN02990966_04365 [Rhodospirillales bacterium URHD0017]|nr:hypothetical protein SAMN02990966_04365 [Rhodospirillales bacterium URHD0017]